MEAVSLSQFFSVTWWLTYLLENYKEDPLHVVFEIICIVIILYLLFAKSYSPSQFTELTKAEQDNLIAEWTPEPLCPALTEEQKNVEFVVVESGAGAHVQIAGKQHLNMASCNFLGLADSPGLKEECRNTIDKYGVGSCGPRGFYGSIDVHLEFERAMADFLKANDSILYSDGLVLVTSVIPAFAKRGDLIICDEGISYGAKQGIMLSKSNLLTYKHNDMDELESILKNLEDKEKKQSRKKVVRKFIVVEGIYSYHGDLAHLNKIVELKKKYKYRLLLDDTFAFGVLGKTGRGSPEHWGIPMSEIDIYCVSADASLATTGGLCLGATDVVCDHQRLSGSGYCFSASSPPFCSVAGTYNIKQLESRPELCEEVRTKSAFLRKQLKQIEGVDFLGDDISPVIHLRLTRSLGDGQEDYLYMNTVAKLMREKGIIVEAPYYITIEKLHPRPSIKLCVTVCHTEKELSQCAKALKESFNAALKA